MKYEIKIIPANESKDIREAWNNYVEQHEKSQLYHLFEWKSVIQKSFSHDACYFYAVENSNKWKGILPLIHINSLLFGNYAVSLPFFNHGGMLADDVNTEQALLDAAINYFRDKKTTHFELRCDDQKQFKLPVKKSKISMFLDFPPSPEDLFKSFPSKLRSQIRRPEKENMHFKSGGLELLEDFYKVFSVNMRDLGTPVYSKKLFANILKAFPKKSWLGVVYSKNIPVAAGFIIGYKKMMEIPWASSLRKYNRFSPNMMLYWHMLKLAMENGFKVFDFGRCTPGEGTYKFKKQWGAREHQLYWYYWLKKGDALPEMNPDNPKYKLAIGLWQKLPVWITKIIGPSIVKNLP